MTLSRRPQREAVAYRWLEGSSRFALVVQRIDYRVIGVPIINPDLTSEAFEDGCDATA
jgi:hypothetical protein